MGAEQSSQNDSLSSFSAVGGAKEKKLFGARRPPDGIVTVSTGKNAEQDLSQDEDIKKLSEIPTFYPLLKSQLSAGSSKDSGAVADVCSKIDHRALSSICTQLQAHMNASSDLVLREQHLLAKRIHEVDTAIGSLAHALAQRQKSFSHSVKELQRVSDLSLSLRKIDAILPELVESCRVLNQSLPPDLRLEPLDLSSFAESHVFLTRSSSLPSSKPSGSGTMSGGLGHHALPKDLSLDLHQLHLDVQEERVIDQTHPK